MIIETVGTWQLAKYGYLMQPGIFPDKVTPDINLTDEVVVQCDIIVLKIPFWALAIYK